MRNTHYRTCNMAGKPKNGGKETQTHTHTHTHTHTIRHGICQETLKNVGNEKCALQDLEYVEKTEKPEK